MRAPSAYVHLAYGLGSESYRELHSAGKTPDETPYGFHHAEQLGWKVTFSKDRPESRVRNFIRRAILRCAGFDLLHAIDNRRAIEQADIVWSMEEIEALAICTLSLLLRNGNRFRLIAQSVWLLERWSTYSAIRRWFLRRLVQQADVLTFHSHAYLAHAAAAFPEARSILLYFGISEQCFQLLPTDDCPLSARETRKMRMLSIGNDPTRDWETIFEAFGGDPRFEVVIVSNAVTDAMAARYDNLTCPRNPSMDDFRKLYEWCDFVIVAMVPNLYSGITVALEAASVGRAILASNTGGIPTYFSAEEVAYVAPQAPDLLRTKALSMDSGERFDLASRARKRFVEESYTTAGLAARYVALSSEILGFSAD